MEHTGYIYILTNPSFPNYVKIGYATNVEERVAQLNQSECIPFSFRIYATYAVDVNLADRQFHKLIDSLNPVLRSVETREEGRDRVREFFAIDPEDAYGLFEAIAAMHGFESRLKKYDMTQKEISEAKAAENVARLASFAFSMCDIQPGEEIEFYDDPNIKAKVVSDRKVEYQGQIYSLTGLAKMLTHTESALAGPKFFKYKGEWLNDIRHRLNPDE